MHKADEKCFHEKQPCLDDDAWSPIEATLVVAPRGGSVGGVPYGSDLLVGV